jgi:hypothetical protein
VYDICQRSTLLKIVDIIHIVVHLLMQVVTSEKPEMNNYSSFGQIQHSLMYRNVQTYIQAYIHILIDGSKGKNYCNTKYVTVDLTISLFSSADKKNILF